MSLSKFIEQEERRLKALAEFPEIRGIQREIKKIEALKESKELAEESQDLSDASYRWLRKRDEEFSDVSR